MRRFFYIDASLATGNLKGSSTSGGGSGAGTTGSSNGYITSGSYAVQFPASMKLSITIRSDARNKIYPPTLTITYEDPSTTPRLCLSYC